MTAPTTKLCALALAIGALAAPARAQDSTGATDPRVGLKAGWHDAGQAIRGLTLVSHVDRPQGFFNPENPGDFAFLNGDLAFRGTLVFQGGFNGLQIWDIANPAAPTLRLAMPCPGGQGDVSVYRNLLFMSVEEKRGRTNCGGEPFGEADSVSSERFRGVRIFDISDIEHPKQVADVQTCRGSHTHTLVTDPADKANVYVYVSGTSSVRPAAELAGCSGARPEQDPNTSLFRIEVIKVPLARPQDAKIVAMPRLFADVSGKNIAALQPLDTSDVSHKRAETNQCHDITVYPQLGLAAGACSGNGLLLDISNPARPRRIAEVSDPNFSYWHSATFSNDGRKLLFSDEWGGGMQPRCQATDRREWGADAIFTISHRTMTPAGYYKLPAPQTATEDCVAHNGSLIPVPGRDIMVQAWYQGGLSVFDFTDASPAKEIAFVDRGPESDSALYIGGYWSTYWYNGHIVGSEIGRGLDILTLAPSDQLSANEIAAAELVHMDTFNPQLQTRFTWPAAFVVARAYADQLERSGGLAADRLTKVRSDLDAAEKLSGARRTSALNRLAASLEADAAKSNDAAKVRTLATTVRGLTRATK